MRNQACLAALFFACFAILFISCKDKKEARKSKYDNMAGLMDWEFRVAMDPYLNTVPTERLIEAKRVRNEIIEAREGLRAPVPDITWQERGPNNVGGRTRVLWFDLGDAVNGYRKVWAAGVAGGLWYTNDITVASPSWVKINDLFENMAVCAFVQSRTNTQIMYFGTGEGWFNSDAQQGAGIWKSTDGGVNWARLSSTQTFYYVQDLIIDNNDNLFATIRPNNQGTGDIGIQRSTDGGANWTTVLSAPEVPSSRGGDLELAANGDIYVSMGTLQSNGAIRRSSFATHLANTGDIGTWDNITPNAAGTITAPSSLWHRIELACAPSNANIVYALFQGFNSNDCVSIQQYDASTNTWNVRTVPNIIDQGSNSVFTRSQAFYDLIATVDPNNAASVYIGGIDALRSDDWGQTWTQMTTWSLFGATGFTANQNVHADHHAIVYAPGSSQRALWGTDGGVYYTTNAGITGVGNKPNFSSKNTGYNVTQYYSAAIHPVTTNYILAGAQDNGTHKFNGAGLVNTTEVSGGDGGFCHIDQDDPSVQITSYVYNNYYVSRDGGTSFPSYSLNNRGDFINASDYASGPNILYASDAGGYYFRWTSPHNAYQATDIRDQVTVTAFSGSRARHVAVSPITANRVFFGMSNGSVVMVDDANTGTSKTGVVIKPATTPSSNVSCIAIDPANENHLLVTYSNYGVNSVHETFNALSGSPTWTSVEGNLPDMPVRWAVFDPRNSDWVLLATELGIWSTNNLDGSSTEWNPTNNGLANVRVDMLKMRTSDRTLVAATHGRGLFTAVIPAPTTADINFATGITSTSEETSFLDGCRGYRDHTVMLNILNPPTGNATVNVTLQSGTAVQGVDFNYTTNGSFSTPSTSAIFADGVTDAKTITIRIYDDAEVEAGESFTLNYTISGSSDAQPGNGAQEHSVTIADNDAAPVSSVSQTYTIGGATNYLNTNASTGHPFDARLQRKKSQMLYKASELTALGMVAGNITTIAFNIEKYSTRPYLNFQVRMGQTALNYLVDGSVNIVPVSTVKNPFSLTTVNGFNTISLDVPFSWDGTSNVVIEICYDNGTADAANFSDRTIGYFDGGTASQGNIFWQDNILCSAAFTSPGAFGSGLKPQMRFGLTTAGTVIASAVITRNDYLAPDNDIYIYNNTGQIMARVRNLSGSHNYACTSFEIDRAGTGATNFWNSNAANRLMNKTLRIVPSSNNASGSYEITLYYSQAEVAGWEAATGQSFNNIQMIKVQGRISDVTPATPTAGGTVNVVAPTIGTLGTSRTLTFTFSNGFSGFGAGIPGGALPIRLSDFTGHLAGKGIRLDWKTSSESNSKGFDIERSYDGVNFKKIGWVAAAGTSNDARFYGFTDNAIPQEVNYYRLNQVDLDHKSEYSKVIVIRSNVIAKYSVQLLQNPVRENIDILFSNVPASTVRIQLSDITGRIVMRWNDQFVTMPRMRLPLSGKNISKGVYVLHIWADGKEFVHRVVKE